MTTETRGASPAPACREALNAAKVDGLKDFGEFKRRVAAGLPLKR